MLLLQRSSAPKPASPPARRPAHASQHRGSPHHVPGPYQLEWAAGPPWQATSGLGQGARPGPPGCARPGPQVMGPTCSCTDAGHKAAGDLPPHCGSHKAGPEVVAAARMLLAAGAPGERLVQAGGSGQAVVAKPPVHLLERVVPAQRQSERMALRTADPACGDECSCRASSACAPPRGRAATGVFVCL